MDNVLFDNLVNSFLENEVGTTEGFLKPVLAAQLKSNLIRLFAKNKLTNAGIGNNELFNNDLLIRSDKIYWLDRIHENPPENAFLAIIDLFVIFLNETCFAGIKSYEFHYALYEPGSFYKRHLDQFKSNKGRAFSMIFYLNSDWLENDGGELCIYHKDHLQIVTPTEGKCVFFKSDQLEHEVLITKKSRMSITGWLKTE